MPKIPTFTARTETSRPFGTEQLDAPRESPLTPLARGVTDLVGSLDRIAEEEDNLFALREVSKFRGDALERLRVGKEKAPVGALGFTEDQVRQFDEAADALIDSAPSRRARSRIEQSLTAFRPAIQQEAISFESGARTSQRRGIIESSVDRASADLVSRPGLFQTVTADTLAAIDSSLLPPTIKDAVMKEARRKLALSAVQGTIEQNPSLAIAQLNKGSFDDFLDGPSKAALINRAQSEIRSRNAQAAIGIAIARGKIEDIAAAAQSGNKEALAKSQRITRDELIRQLGPRIGPETEKQLRASELIGQFKIDAIQAPDGELNALLKARSFDLKGPDTEDFRLKSAVNAELTKVVLGRRKALADDSAGFVAAANPAIGQALQQFVSSLSDPAATPETTSRLAREYTSATVAEQKRLGVEVPKVFSTDFSDAIVRTFQAIPKETDKLNFVNRLRDSFAPETRNVALAQLSASAKSIDFDLLTSLPQTPAGQITAIRLLRAMKTDDKTFKEIITETDRKQVGEKIQSESEELRSSLAVAGAPERASAYEKIAERYAFSLLAERVETSAGSAAERAHADLFKSHTKMVGLVRVPREADTSRVLALQKERIAKLGELPLIVPRAEGISATLPEAEIKKQYISHLQQFGVWLTTADNRGMILFSRVGGPSGVPIPVLLRSGQPLFVEFDEPLGARRAPQIGPLGVPVETQLPFANPRGGVTGQEP